MARSINVKILGDASDLTRAYRQAAGSTQTFGSQLGAMGKAAAFSAGAAGLGLLTVALVDSVKAASEAEKSQKLMETAVSQGGQSYKTFAAAIEEAVTATSKLSGLDDEALQDSFSSLVRTTGSVEEALDAMSLAADVARGRNISLEAATALVTKAELGKEGALTRAGIALDGAKGKMELLAVLQEKYAGSAETYGNTTAGAHDKLRVAVENLEERVGSVLLPALTAWAEHMTTVIDKVDKITTALGFLKPVIEAVAFLLSLQFKAALALADLYVTILTTSVDAAKAAFGAAKTAAQTLATFFEGAWKTATGVAKTAAAAVDGAIDGVKAAFSATRTAAGNVVEFFEGKLKTAFNAAKAPIAALDGVVSGLAGAFNAVVSAIKSLISWIGKIPSKISLPSIPGGGLIDKLNPFDDRATGGPVSAGGLYRVGERGPELFAPRMSGTIIPNHALAGGGVTVNIYAPIGSQRDLENMVVSALTNVRNRGGLS
jgi:hypothetical protein